MTGIFSVFVKWPQIYLYSLLLLDIYMRYCLFTFLFTYRKIYYFWCKVIGVLTNKCSHVTITTVKIQNGPITHGPNPSCYAFAVTLCHWQLLVSSPSPNFCLVENHIGGIIQYINFWDWLLLLSPKPLRFLQVVVCMGTFPVYRWVAFHCVHMERTVYLSLIEENFNEGLFSSQKTRWEEGVSEEGELFQETETVAMRPEEKGHR